MDPSYVVNITANIVIFTTINCNSDTFYIEVYFFSVIRFKVK